MEARPMPRAVRIMGGLALACGLLFSLPVGLPAQRALAATEPGAVVLGDNTAGEATVPAGLSDVTAISAGGDFALALKRDGTVVAWGDNSFSQTEVPAGLSGVTAISAGTNFSLALKSDGTVVALGYNGGGLDIPAGLSGVTAVSAGDDFGLALRGDGTVVAWGYDTEGETSVPAALSGVIAVSAGKMNGLCLALKSDGTVVAWGYGSRPWMAVPAGLADVTAVSAGALFGLALKSDGTVVAWGRNAVGQTNVPAGLSGVTAISAGTYHSLALKRDGTVVAWGVTRGDWYGGQTAVPEGLSGVTAVSAGLWGSLALKSDGTVVAWGSRPARPASSATAESTPTGPIASESGSPGTAIAPSSNLSPWLPGLPIGVALGAIALAALLVLVRSRRQTGAAEVASRLSLSQESQPPTGLPDPLRLAGPASVWLATHTVPAGGMPAWEVPDMSRQPVASLGPGLELVVEQRAGDWAKVRAENGWTGWVDGHRLVERM